MGRRRIVFQDVAVVENDAVGLPRRQRDPKRPAIKRRGDLGEHAKTFTGKTRSATSRSSRPCVGTATSNGDHDELVALTPCCGEVKGHAVPPKAVQRSLAARTARGTRLVFDRRNHVRQYWAVPVSGDVHGNQRAVLAHCAYAVSVRPTQPRPSEIGSGHRSWLGRNDWNDALHRSVR